MDGRSRRRRLAGFVMMIAAFVPVGCTNDDTDRGRDVDEPTIGANLYYYDGPSPGFATPIPATRR
ncbi:hypothetical protein [Embleya sp. NPDC005971]|uniref:hypothetical protein n=1 Tax=unclassified Embleya TaxID=2699296 RepID=UPI0033F7A8BE